MSEKNELDVLLEQLEELLASGAVDVSDALEITTCAGLAARLGATGAELADALAWRSGTGADLVTELFETIDTEPLVDGIEGLLGTDPDERTLEEAVFDFDDLVAACVWCSRNGAVKEAARSVAQTIRLAPELFAPLAPYGQQMSRLPAVAEELGLYDYWLALADASAEA